MGTSNWSASIKGYNSMNQIFVHGWEIGFNKNHQNPPINNKSSVNNRIKNKKSTLKYFEILQKVGPIPTSYK